VEIPAWHLQVSMLRLWTNSSLKRRKSRLLIEWLSGTLILRLKRVLDGITC